MPLKPVLIRGMWGLGDNCYSRPFIRATAAQYDVYLDTPWPELYDDLDIKFVRGDRRLRTQQKNLARQEADRWARPFPMREFRVAYTFGTTGIINSMERRWASLGIDFDPSLFDLPDMGPAPITSERPIAVVRPVTVRSEWRNEARNPLPEYVSALAGYLMETHTVVVVADLEINQEWLVGQCPSAHHYFLKGELSVRYLLALVRNADIVIGGVGWIVPASLALKVKAFILLGGNGAHNAPEKITDPRLDLSRIGFAMPNRFCRCSNMLHRCDKQMAEPLAQFIRWQDSLRAVA